MVCSACHGVAHPVDHMDDDLYINLVIWSTRMIRVQKVLYFATIAAMVFEASQSAPWLYSICFIVL